MVGLLVGGLISAKLQIAKVYGRAYRIQRIESLPLIDKPRTGRDD